MDGHRVLIVEDHDATRLALRSVFIHHGWQVETAATLSEAFMHLDPAPDCLVLDICLPDGDGTSLLQKVRAEHIPTRTVAVTTGLFDPARLAVIKDLKPNLILSKPVDWGVLCRVCASDVSQGNPGNEVSSSHDHYE